MRRMTTRKRSNHSREEEPIVTRQEVSEFEALETQVRGLYEETDKLAAKKPNDAINKFKLGIANQLLRRSNTLLGKPYPLEGFTEFSEEEMPSSSDVQVVLSQYLRAMEKLRADNVTNHYQSWYWIIDGSQSDVRTGAPKKIGK